MTIKDWDPRNEYSDVVKAVEEASGGSKAGVYRTAKTHGTKIWYWLVAVDKKQKALVGVKAQAVET